MQARLFTFTAIALAMAAATPASAEDFTLAELQARGACPELPICAHCSSDNSATADEAAHASPSDVAAPPAEDGLKYNFAGIEAAAAEPTGAPDQVQTAPQANMPIFLELGGIPGESSETPPPPPPPPPPQNAPTAQPGVQAQNTGETAALIVPAVQRVREAAAAPRNAPPTGETRLMPEIPICAHCGADIIQPAAQQGIGDDPPQETAVAAQQEQPRQRRRFSLSIGGVTLSSDGGVNVAVGDVTGDGRGESSERGGDRASSSARPANRRSN